MQFNHITIDTSQGACREPALAACLVVRPMRHLPLRFVVEFDGKRDQEVREESR